MHTYNQSPNVSITCTTLLICLFLQQGLIPTYNYKKTFYLLYSLIQFKFTVYNLMHIIYLPKYYNNQKNNISIVNVTENIQLNQCCFNNKITQIQNDINTTKVKSVIKKKPTICTANVITAQNDCKSNLKKSESTSTPHNIYTPAFFKFQAQLQTQLNIYIYVFIYKIQNHIVSLHFNQFNPNQLLITITIIS
eukprot:TRINITY_DN3648_c0_g3_i10.p1 TRINITY_DN3648_c0_g3~~TRINITY_DN3648_c0_g3_i10.p1  ORF type:complete len:193 (-),score=-25.84 TRINITY_DN3648_c0_g3_i10:178-756(-)